jgi:C4-dicarboxylate transporter DctM subunit
MKKRITIFTVTLAVIFGILSCSGNKNAATAAKTRTLNFHTIQVENSVYSKTAVVYGEMIAKNSNGLLQVKVYPNGTLSGSDQAKAIEMIQRGTIDMGLVSGVVLASVVKDMSLTCLPWMFSGFEGVDAALSTGTKAFNLFKDQYLAKDLILIGMAEHGFRQLDCSKKTITKPSDLDNLKFRVLGNPVLNSLFMAFGANPTSINPAEIYTALQNGTIDGEENPILYSYPAKLHEVSPYFTIWNYSYDVHPLLMGKNKWESLFDAERQVIQKTADEWIPIQKEMMRKAQDEYIENIQKEGGTVTILSLDQIQEFRKIGDPIVSNAIPQFTKEIYDAIKGVQK